MSDTFHGTLRTARHAVFTITPTGGSAWAATTQGYNFSRTAPEAELKSGGHVVKRSREESVDTMEFDWVFTDSNYSDIGNFTIPAMDDVVTLAFTDGITALAGDWNIDDFKITGKEGDDLKGSGRVKRNNGAALPLLTD